MGSDETWTILSYGSVRVTVAGCSSYKGILVISRAWVTVIVRAIHFSGHDECGLRETAKFPEYVILAVICEYKILRFQVCYDFAGFFCDFMKSSEILRSNQSKDNLNCHCHWWCCRWWPNAPTCAKKVDHHAVCDCNGVPVIMLVEIFVGAKFCDFFPYCKIHKI